VRVSRRTPLAPPSTGSLCQCSAVRLYLSSFRLGDHTDELLRLRDGTGPVAVVANAMDAAPADVRRAGVEREVAALAGLGLDAVELDLREPAPAQGWAERLAGHRLLWVRGGNSFVLRAALARSGADVAITGLIAADRLVYAGYSAGACVLAPSLRGLELVDDPVEVEQTYGGGPVWEGLGVLPHAVVPHVRSPGHPETADCDALAAEYERTGVEHVALRDGQVLVVDDTGSRVL
jgi:dipeptidase E